MPALTASDEEEIDVLKQQAAPKSESTSRVPQASLTDSQISSRISREFDESEHLSRLDDSTALFSPSSSVNLSPEPFRQVKEQSRPATSTSESPKRNLAVNKTISDARKARGKMAIEREPPKSAVVSPTKQNNPAFSRENPEEIMNLIGFSPQNSNQHHLGNNQHPEFGNASSLHNRLQSSVFNIPKRHQPRPEHHRPIMEGHANLQGNDQVRAFKIPGQPSHSAQPKNDAQIPNDADFVEIPRPANHPIWSTHRPVRPTFSSFVPVNVDKRTRLENFMDLTSSVNQFNPDQAIFDSNFGAVDPYEYVDVGKATENIKALLEGAFDDDDDKPRTRARKKKAESLVSALAGKLQNLEVDNEQNNGKTNDEEEEEEEEEEDGTMEGLRVKLLPHQVEGVEWMRDKEVGTTKKNGVLPKGGILADDVSQLVRIEGLC